MGFPLVLGLIIGSTVGVLLMGAMNANGPSVDDALFHLGRWHWLLDEMGAIPVEGGVMDNARQFLLRWGEGEGLG